MSKQQDDVEELKRIIEQKNDEIFKLQNVLSDLPGSIYWKDKNGVYLGRNKTSEASLKSMNFSSDIVGKTDYDLFPKDMADGFRKHDLEIMESGKESSREETAILANGEKVIQLSTKRPLYDQQGQIVGIVGNTVDITFLKKIESELRTAVDKAEQANAIKIDFIRNMEHDIRTPFSGIYGMANMLAEREQDPEKKEILTMMAICTKELFDYCNSILDFSKIESGSLPLISKKFNVRELVESVIYMEKPPARNKNLKLELSYDEKVPMVVIGDEHRLQRILINLLSNAIKFTKEGFVKLEVTMPKQIDKRNIILQFIVEDSGIGIQKREQAIIFEKFTRLTPANKNLYKGLGLGLHIVKQFMAEMDGDIDIVSEEGIGSKFICALPFIVPLIDTVSD